MTTERDDIETSVTVRAYRAVEQKMDLYGSFVKWPTLSLLPIQFQFCRCGRRRGKHKYEGINLVCHVNKSGLFEARGVDR